MTTAFDRISAMTGEQRTTLADRFAKASRLAGGEPVAVVGVGCRFPGDVHGLDSYWQLLVEGHDAITEVPDDRWDAERYYDPDWSTPGRMNTKWGGFLSDIADFDAEFFGIAPREAETMDPQQRLLLEVTWEALEHAGIRPDSLSETRTAVMVGVYRNEYLAASLADSESMSAYWATGNAHSITVGRISYLLGLRGPAVAFDTACSSSLVAVHEACQCLRMRESDVALAGGVSLMLRAETQLAMSAWGMFSPSGKCRSFDAGADGFVRGEGCGVVVLKRLTDALRDGDRVLAVVRGSAINSDGRSNGLTAPNAPSQRDVITAALRNADVTAESVNYIETHGTGTTLGDPIEFDAVAQTYGRGAGKCALGAVKTNIGHLEAAAGIAGFIKATLALRHGHIPPNLNFVDWNPAINASGTRLFVPTTNAAWPVTDGPRRAAVSSFGFGGTNAHIILEQGPDADAASAPASSVTTLVLSAKTSERLSTWAATLANWLEGPGAQVPLADVADTLAHRRARYPVLATVSACNPAQAVDGLRALARHQPAVGVVGPTPRRRGRGTVFVYSGQGSQWTGMCRQLLVDEPAFASSVAELEPDFVAQTGFSLKKVLSSGEPVTDIARIQPVLVGLQLALTNLWHSYRIEPDAVIGHSMGEVTAAVVAGALSVADGLRVIATRSRLMSRLSGQGAMALLELDAEAAAALLADYPDVTLAGYAAPRQTVIAGPQDRVHAIIEAVLEQNRLACLVEGDTASHHRLIDPVLPELRTLLSDLTPAAPTIPILSTTREHDPTPMFDAQYWADNLRNPVRFHQAVAAAARHHDTIVEVSPHPVLLRAVNDTLDYIGAAGRVQVLPTLNRENRENLFFHTQLAAIAPPKVDAAASRLADLPTTPWRHARFWVEDRPGDLEESPETAPSAERGPQVLLLSARNAESLQDARTSLAETLARGDALALPDVAYTLAHRRSEEHRLVAVVHDRATAAGLLTAAEHDNVSVAQCPQGIPAGTERVAFLFPGQGAQHIGMARGLFDIEPVFREHFDRCAAGLTDDLGIDLKDQVFAGTDLERTDLAQPALFAVEYALAQLAMSYGVKPAALAGHSIGELVAATVADVFDLPTALRVVALRARLMHAAPGGAMLAVAATPENIRAYLGDDVDVAAINDPASCVIGGSEDAIAALTDRLAAQGILARRVRTSHAFHSRSMDEVLLPFAEYLASVTLHEPTIPMLSNITGTWMTAAEATDPERWARHIRSTVQFADEVQVLLGDPHRVLVEVGPGGSLTGSAVRLPAWGGTHRAVRPMRHPLQSRDDRDAFLLALGQLWSAGIDVDWTALQGEQAHRVTLPGYPSAYQRHWIEPANVQRVVTSAGRRTDAAPASTNGADPRSQMQATLQRIWAHCLGLESVNPRDNFFELGGDSLMAVGVAMAANYEGLDLTPQDLYENHSLAALADTLVARYASGGLTSDVPADLGLPLPPNICRFLDTGLAERGRWRVPLVLRLDSRVSAADVIAVVSAVISHHDALRMRVVKRSGTWEQQIAEPGAFTDVVERALPSAVASDSVEEREALSAIVSDTVRDQDLRSWPLTATYVTDATGAARFLLLTVHQMVNDTTSREVLLTDLLTALAQRLVGQDIALEPVSTSWREWSRRCAALSAHPAVLDRRGYWLNVAKASLRVAESGAAGQPPGADDLVRLPGALTTEQTSMIDNARRLLQVGIDEILLSGFARTIAAVVGEGIIAVDLAGTGRSVLKPEVDLRRTVGWFSTIYPFALPCVKPAATGAAHLLAEIRQNFKAVPYHGIGYGVLRYLHAPTARLLEAVAAPDIHFTYLGMIPEWPESDAEVHWDSRSEPAHWDTVPGLGHPIELRVYRRGGALHVDFWYDRRRVPGATIEALAERFPATLIGLVDEAVTGHVGERATDAEDEALALVDLSAAVLKDGD